MSFIFWLNRPYIDAMIQPEFSDVCEFESRFWELALPPNISITKAPYFISLSSGIAIADTWKVFTMFYVAFLYLNLYTWETGREELLWTLPRSVMPPFLPQTVCPINFIPGIEWFSDVEYNHTLHT